MKFTVLGASGFIGSRLARRLRDAGHECFTPGRDDPAVYAADLGHTIYCIGLTADFRQRPFDTVQAHVCRLVELLGGARFESFLYLSSTRVYGGASSGTEDASLQVNPLDPGDLYNLSKLMGESVCLAAGRDTVRVARLSNVYGDDFASDNFLCSIIRDAVDKKRLVLETTPDSAKDYISVRDVVAMLPRIAVSWRQRLYNVASGVNVSNRELLDRLRTATHCQADVTERARTVSFPRISIERLQGEFGFAPARLLDDLDELLSTYGARAGRTSAVQEQR